MKKLIFLLSMVIFTFIVIPSPVIDIDIGYDVEYSIPSDYINVDVPDISIENPYIISCMEAIPLIYPVVESVTTIISYPSFMLQSLIIETSSFITEGLAISNNTITKEAKDAPEN